MTNKFQLSRVIGHSVIGHFNTLDFWLTDPPPSFHTLLVKLCYFRSILSQRERTREAVHALAA